MDNPKMKISKKDKAGEGSHLALNHLTSLVKWLRASRGHYFAMQGEISHPPYLLIVDGTSLVRRYFLSIPCQNLSKITLKRLFFFLQSIACCSNLHRYFSDSFCDNFLNPCCLNLKKLILKHHSVVIDGCFRMMYK